MAEKDHNLLWALALGIPLEKLNFDKPDPGTVPQAPNRHPQLTEQEFAQAIRNHLRYFPSEMHSKLALDFAEELRTRGHIWMERLRPTEYEMKAYPIDMYPALLPQCKAIQLMIQNNLDPNVAQYPHQLTTYGGNGCVFANWAQYHLTMQYLSEMQEDQTLVMYSGHPMGLFPSHKDAPRVVITNGMVIPNYSSKETYEKMYAMGCSMYGQMTAGSYCYIGSQGIVHGTTITLINAGRKYLGSEDLRGKVFVTSGLGGMSGAQPKAGLISGCVSVTAEVNESALMKRYRQGWVKEVAKSVEETIARIKTARASAETTSIAYLGNVVELWEALAQESEMLVDLGSDQTSLHDPYGGGYYPVQVSYEEGKRLITEDPARFRALVQESLKRQVAAINILTARGMRFWDYGNSFLLEASRAGADIWRDDTHLEFRYPSYVQDIMGDIFSLGFGPFRWVCTSGDPRDLAVTDRLATEVISDFISSPETPIPTRNQYADNLKWIKEAGTNNLVIGSQARILYSDTLGRVQIALKFNEAIRNGEISAPVVLARDHHDVSGTDSPYRETANITDGSMFTADMAVQNVIGDGFRGATWVALHNGGGVGWGEVINGGFGLVLDGSQDAGRRAGLMLEWDTVNGISRRSWSGNAFAESTIKRLMSLNPKLVVTVPHPVSPDVHIPTN